MSTRCTPRSITPVNFLVGHYGAAYATFPTADTIAECFDPARHTRRADNECAFDRVPNGVWMDVKHCVDENGAY